MKKKLANITWWGVVTGLQMIVTGEAKIPTSDDLDPSYEVHPSRAMMLFAVGGGIIVLAFFRSLRG